MIFFDKTLYFCLAGQVFEIGFQIENFGDGKFVLGIAALSGIREIKSKPKLGYMGRQWF